MSPRLVREALSASAKYKVALFIMALGNISMRLFFGEEKL